MHEDRRAARVALWAARIGKGIARVPQPARRAGDDERRRQRGLSLTAAGLRPQCNILCHSGAMAYKGLLAGVKFA